MSAYNEKLDWLSKSVESILNQTYENLEFIIVLDNPENSGIKKMLEHYRAKDERIKLIINDKNLGLVKSLNIALAHCTGRYIARMDADDISIPERLEMQTNCLVNQELDFLFSGVQIIDEDDAVLYHSNLQEMDARQSRRRLENVHISFHPTWFFKSDILQDLERYREISYCEDYDFILRCLARNYKVGKMSGYVLQYRVRESGISKTFSLEQFLNTRGLVKLYKAGKLEDDSLLVEILQNSKRIAVEEEKKKFNMADTFYYQGVNLIKSGNRIRGVGSLTKSLFYSRYYFIRNLDILKYKMINHST